MVRGVGGVGGVKIVLSMVWDIGRAVPRWILSTFNFIIVVSKKNISMNKFLKFYIRMIAKYFTYKAEKGGGSRHKKCL